MKTKSTQSKKVATDHIWWSIPQTLTWIMHRQDASIDLIPAKTTPFDILIDLFGSEADGGDRSVRLTASLDVRNDFLAKVRSGVLAVWASRTPDGSMEIVTAADWLTIDALSGNNPNFPPDALGGNYDDRPRYYRSRIRRDDAVAIWPVSALKRSTDLEIKRVVEDAIRDNGGRLPVEKLDKLELEYRKTNSTVPQREKFRDMQIALQGEGKRGRVSKKQIP